MRNRKSVDNRGIIVFGLGILLAGAAVQAGPVINIAQLDMFRNNEYEQTGDGNSLSNVGYFFSADLYSVSAGNFTSASFGPPVPPAYNMPQVSSTQFHYQSGFFANQAAMDTTFPKGTYLFQTSTGEAASVNYAADDYPRSNPYLTGSTYSALQGMNAAKPFTFTVSPFLPGATADSSNEFLTIYSGGNVVWSDDSLPFSTTSITLPANTLKPGMIYTFDLDYTTLNVVPSVETVFDAHLGFDNRTDGSFSTTEVTRVVPLPNSAAGGLLLLLGGGTYAMIRNFRRKTV